MNIFSRFTFFALVLVMSALVTMPASAATFTQLWAVDTNNVDKIEFFLIAPTSGFDSPAITALPGGWAANTVNPGYVMASGPAVSAGTTYIMNFSTPVNDALTLDVLEWNGSTVQEHLRFFYKTQTTSGFTKDYGDWYWSLGAGGSFVDVSLGNTPYDRTPIPEPSTYALMGAGLAALGFYRRRRQTASK